MSRINPPKKRQSSIRREEARDAKIAREENLESIRESEQDKGAEGDVGDIGLAAGSVGEGV